MFVVQGAGRGDGDPASRYELVQQLRRVNREKDELEKSLQGYIDSSEHAKDECSQLRYQLSEMKRENERLKEKVMTLGPGED